MPLHTTTLDRRDPPVPPTWAVLAFLALRMVLRTGSRVVQNIAKRVSRPVTLHTQRDACRRVDRAAGDGKLHVVHDRYTGERAVPKMHAGLSDLPCRVQTCKNASHLLPQIFWERCTRSRPSCSRTARRELPHSSCPAHRNKKEAPRGPRECLRALE